MNGRSTPPTEYLSTVRMASDAQIKFIRDLATAAEMNDEHRAEIIARCDSGDITFDRARDWIPRLQALPKRPTGSSSWNAGNGIKVEYEEHELDDGSQHRIGYIVGAGEHRIPRGRYALDTTGDDHFANDTTFFRVWVGDRGGWAVNVQASDDWHPVTGWPKRIAVLKAIAADPLDALQRYGRELGKCGVCGRTLTNDESRALGIGPVCRTKL
jgi:hypothetical protein